MPCENGNGKQFWLLLCDKPIQIVVENFIDPYKNTYYEGDYVIRGCKYDLLQFEIKTYYFNEEVEPVYIYSHLVCVSKFTMPPTSHNIRGSYPTFELPVETHQWWYVICWWLLT